MTEYCPVLKPTFEEFIHPKEYIKSIEHIVIKHGICKIIPPIGWNPRHSQFCICGPGNFMKVCTNNAKVNKPNTNRFAQHRNPDNYVKSSDQTTPECACNLNVFGDINGNHMQSCPLTKQIHSGNGTLKSESAISDPVNIEQSHRNHFGNDILGKTIKQLSMADINCFVHVYLPFDHIFYEAKIVSINLLINSCDIQLIGDAFNQENITIYPMETVVIKLRRYKVDSDSEEKNLNSSTDTISASVGYEMVNDSHCPSMLGHQFSQRLNEISNIDHCLSMGRIPSNSVNASVSMDTQVYADDYDQDSEDRFAKPMISNNDTVLRNKSITDTNDKCEYLCDMIIKAPIRQNLYQSITAKGGAYHCVNVVEHDIMSVRYFHEKTQSELKSEIRNSKKTAKIMKWINKDLIEQHFDEILRELIRNLTFKHPLYGADTVGSLFHPNQVWNLGSFDSILNLIENDIEGVTVPYLYFGSWRSCFVWHIEDRALWALNYLHFGKPKIWFAVPSKDVKKMEQIMATNFPQNNADCSVFTRHKISYIIPKKLTENGVTMYKAVQRANEIVIVAPNAYHSGFNLGFNCAEAVNFATPSWIPLGIDAPDCQCGMMQTSVYFDIQQLINEIQEKYPRLAAEIPELPKNYQKKLMKQESLRKRTLDYEDVQPKKRQKLSLTKTVKECS